MGMKRDEVIKKHKKGRKTRKQKHKHVHKRKCRGESIQERVIFTALVTTDRSDSGIPVIFSLECTVLRRLLPSNRKYKRRAVPRCLVS